MFTTKRSDYLRRHLKNVHNVDKNKAFCSKSSDRISHSGDGFSRYQPRYELKDVQHTLNEIKSIVEDFKSNKSHIPDCVLNIIPDHLTRQCMDPRWKHPLTAIVAGPTGCGKTVFTLKFITLASEMITPVRKKLFGVSAYIRTSSTSFPTSISEKESRILIRSTVRRKLC